MTTTATRTDWAAIRREYGGGDRGVTLVELSQRHRIPLGTLHFHAAEERWREDSAHPASRAAIQRRTRELVVESSDCKASRVYERLVREFGLHPELPSIEAIRKLFPRPEPHVRRTVIEPATLAGLRRRCPGCHQLTTAVPCAHCGAEP